MVTTFHLLWSCIHYGSQPFIHVVLVFVAVFQIKNRINRNGAREKHTHTHSQRDTQRCILHVSQRRHFGPYFYGRLYSSIYVNNKVEDWKKYCFLFLVYLLLKSDTNLCHTPCVIFFACLPLWFHFVFFFSLSFVQIIDNVTFSFSPAFFFIVMEKVLNGLLL